VYLLANAFTEKINKLFGVTESYRIPDKMMELLLDKGSRVQFFDRLIANEADLSTDSLRDYYQDEQGDRNRLKQDFTPDCICDLVAAMLPQEDSCTDLCAGTGALALAYHKRYPSARIHCTELTARSIPFLLTNLAIRGIRGEVIQGNVLTGDISAVYSLACLNGTYSDIDNNGGISLDSSAAIIMNPPYSMKWTPIPHAAYAYDIYGAMPKNVADWPFVLQGLHQLRKGGTLIAVLPHGVLFRGNKERDIRRQLLRMNLIDAVIGLPEKLFLNTCIPVCLVVLKRDRSARDVLFIDASKEYTARGKQNIMEQNHIDAVLSAYHLRKNVERFASVADLDTIRDNEYNLNIPRYVDTYVKPDIVPLDVSIREIIKINEEIQVTAREMYKQMTQLVKPDGDEAFQGAVRDFGRHIGEEDTDD
jgi:type I restriction enzyme M protein